MKRKTIIRCGSKALTVAVVEDFNGESKIVDVLCEKIIPTSDTSTAWMDAVSAALEKIPLKIRYNTDIIIPPNFEVFIKLIKIPHASNGNFKQALHFEFNHAFGGGSSQWVYDSFRPDPKSDSAYCFAMHRSFIENFIDRLLRAHVDFRYMCPEHLLNNVALRSKNKTDCLSLHIGKTVSSVSFVGKNFTHVKNFNIAGDWINRKIAEAADIEYDEAEKRKRDLATTSEDKNVSNASFIAYYLTQFAQRLHVEVKKSELYYCSRFKENPVSDVIISGNGGNYDQVLSTFGQSIAGRVVRDFDIFRDCLGSDLSDDVVYPIKQCLGAFYGAMVCLSNKNIRSVNLFSDDLQDQLIFQRNSPKYMMIIVACVLFMLLCYGFLRSNVTFLEGKKQVLIEKSEEVDRNIANYNKTYDVYSDLIGGIDSIKSIYDGQSSMIDMLNDLQNVVLDIGYAWIDSFNWKNIYISSKTNLSTLGTSDPKLIKITVKRFFENGFTGEKEQQDVVDSLIFKISNLKFVEKIDTVLLEASTDKILKISFNIILKRECGVFFNE